SRKKPAAAVILSPFGVILSAAKNLALPLRVNYAKDHALCIFKAMRDSSSPAAPQNDTGGGFSAACIGGNPIAEISLRRLNLPLQFCRAVRAERFSHLNGAVAPRADGMKKASALGTIVERRIHRSPALWALAHHRLPDHKVDDKPDGVGD